MENTALQLNKRTFRNKTRVGWWLGWAGGRVDGIGEMGRWDGCDEWDGPGGM